MGKRKPKANAVERTVLHRRVGNEVMTLETVATFRNAYIDFKDIMAAHEMENEHSDPPWKTCDGYEHECVRFNDEMEPGRNTRIGNVKKGEQFRPHNFKDEQMLGEKARGCWVMHYNPENVVGRGYHNRELIWLTKENIASWGIYEYHRAHGQSKQVAREIAAENARATLEQLRKWYNEGWYSWAVSIDFHEHSASLCGVECEPDDDYLDQVISDLAEEISEELEKQGYVVSGRPDHTSKESKQKKLWWRMARNLGFEHYRDYRKWITTRPGVKK